VHDIGLQIKRNADGEVGFAVIVGGGLGRTPVVGKTIREFLPKGDLLSYLEAIMRVYNVLGRRDNMYKARIKILVNAVGAEKFAAMVEEEWQHLKDTDLALPAEEVARIEAYFAPPPYAVLDRAEAEREAGLFEAKRLDDPAFAAWVRSNVVPHKVRGYAIANISLKPEGGVPGDATAEQMDAVADLAAQYSFGEIRVTHEQNLVLPYVRRRDLYEVWRGLIAHDLATANLGLISDIIACPGLDYCSLANARSIPVAQQISRRFADLKRQSDIGELKVKISGCINACGHHHVGHIGILGVDKKGEEFYQVTLGGSADENAALGKLVGPAFPSDQIVDAVETVVETYLAIRQNGETLVQTCARVGIEPFKEKLYASH
jgi:sulfite reductase (NADPH) hemoprotein beta-component